MSSAEKKSKSKNAEFWRACRYLHPYRRIVTISIIAAFFVGLISTSGLGLMLPILRVLIAGDTIQSWVDRQIAQKTLGAKLADDPEHVRIITLNPGEAAERAGIRAGDEITSFRGSDYVVPGLSRAGTILYELSTAGGGTFTLADGRQVTLNTPPPPAYLRVGHQIANHLPTHPVKAIAVVFLLIAGLATVANVIRFFQEYLSDKSAISAVNDIRRHLYDHVLHTPMSFFGVQGTSDVTSRLVQDSQNLQDGFKTVLGQCIQEPMKAVFTFALALIASWKLTLFIIIFAPLMATVVKKLGKKMRRASRAALQRSSIMLGQIEGTLIGIRVVKSATAERFERRRYAGIMEELRQEQLKMARYEAWSTPAMETITLFVAGAVLMLAAYQVLIAHTLDVPRFMLVMFCLVGMGESLRRVSKVNNVLQRSNAAAARIFEILDLPMERRRLRAAEKRNVARVKLPAIRREVRFENVTFGYPNSSGPAVQDVSLVVPKGASVAIVGRNGSGKTTLLGLLPRFYDPQSGRVSIDGVDVRDATLRSLRKQIGIVTQDAVLFPGTIAENIAYGDPAASRLRDPNDRGAIELRAKIQDAAKRAFAHDFILEKPNGYDTPLDGLGGQLSGGQKQRINIARAILRQAPILVLDEATSQVDAESEHLIQQAIESLMHERTTFVIAHRFSTILSADTIVVLDRGRIVGQGKHEELLLNCPTYAQLYERQMFAAPVG